MFRQAISISQPWLPSCRLAGLNNIHFLTAAESGKSRIKVPTDLVSGFLAHGFPKAASLLCPHTAGREGALSCLISEGH